MSQRYIAFDVETPNNDNNCMSAIGVCVVVDNKIVAEYYSLVDPEARFDQFNISFTGITPEMVAKSPNFWQLWQDLEPIFSSGLLIAHNAPFDMSVLAKSLDRYEIDWQPMTEYACTCMMSKKAFPELVNHRLDTVSNYLELELEHHNAGSDAKACANILIECIERGIDPLDFKRPYDVYHAHTLKQIKKKSRY